MRNYFSENNILKLIVLLPIVAVIFTSGILTNIFIEAEKENFEQEIQREKELHIAKIKDIIKGRVERTINVIKAKEIANEQRTKNELKSIVLLGYNLLEATYKENQHKSREEFFELLRKTFRNIRFFRNKSGYYFIYDLKGNNIVISPFPHLEGKNLINFKDPYGTFIIKEAIEGLKDKNENYKTWYWWKTKGSEPIKKLGFYKRFEPLNLFIGTGQYYDDIIGDNLKDTISLLNNIKYNDESYIFAISNDGTAVVHKNKNILNRPINTLPDIEKNVVKNILKQAQNNLEEGSYIEYIPTTQKNFNRPSHKISYVKYLPHLQLTIGTGLYTQDLQDTIEEKTKLLQEKLEQTINTIVISACLVTLGLVFIMLLISTSLKRIFNNYAKSLEEKNKSLEELNNSLEQKVDVQVAKNRQKDEMLYHQSKMAAMGEMLANIAHQWRQPLSAISTAASGIKIQDEMNNLQKDIMHEGLDTIVKNTQMLSHTIDDFRNFFTTTKRANEFDIQSCFKKVSTLLEANFKNKNIHIIEEIESIKVITYENELIQALLNILNNSRDALLQNINVKEKYIFIHIYQDKRNLCIDIKDSGGGIDETIIQKIFEPYFTTKHQSQGTGIGLYMTKQIIESSLQGSIEIKNESYTYEDKEYKGVLNQIRLPLN